VAAEAPRLAATTAAGLGLPVAGVGTIVILGPEEGSEDLRDVADIVPKWAAGVTIPSTQTIAIRLDRIGAYGQRELLSVLMHEMAHLTIAEGLPDRGRSLPGWLGEGLASSAAREGEWRDLYIVWTSPLVSSSRPFFDLQAAHERGEASKSLAYAGSLAAVGFLRSTYGEDWPARLLSGMRDGLGFEAAFRKASGVTYGEAEAAWARDLNLPWIWVVRAGSSYTLWLGATLLMLLAWAVKRMRDRRVLARWREEEEPSFPGPGPIGIVRGNDDDEKVH